MDEWNLRRGGSVPIQWPLLDDREESGTSLFTFRQRGITTVLTAGAPITTRLSDVSRPYNALIESHDNVVHPTTLTDLKDMCTLKELLEEHPDDVLTVLRDMSVVQIGTIEMKDSQVLRAFGSRTMLTRSHHCLNDSNWNEEWKSILLDRIGKHKLKKPVGWEQTVVLGVYAISIKNIANREDGDLISVLLQKSSSGAVSEDFWSYPVVQAVVNYHWQHWAQRLYSLVFMLYLIWTLGFLFNIYCYIESSCREDDSDNIPANLFSINSPSSRHGGHMSPSESEEVLDAESQSDCNTNPIFEIFQIVVNFVSFICMCPFGIEEFITVFTQGFRWLQLGNLVDLGTIAIQTIIFTFHFAGLGETNSWMDIILATQVLLLSIRLLRFVRLLSGGSTFFDSALSVIYDVRFWIASVLLTGIVASFMFGSLYRNDTDFHSKHIDFANFWNTLVTTFQIIYGDFDTEYIFDSKYQIVPFLFFSGFQLLMTVTVLNIIIAAMTNSYTSITNEKSLQDLRGRAMAIGELLSIHIPICLRKNHSPFVQFVVVEKKKAGSTNAQSGIGEASALVECKQAIENLSNKLDNVAHLVETLAMKMATNSRISRSKEADD